MITVYVREATVIETLSIIRKGAAAEMTKPDQKDCWGILLSDLKSFRIPK